MMNRFGVTSSLAVVVLLATMAYTAQLPTSTPCSLSFYRYLYNLPGEKIRPNVPEGTYIFGQRVGPPTPEGQASDARPTVVKPPYEAPLYLPPTTSTTTTTTTTARPSTSAPVYIPPPSDYPADSSNSVSVSVVPAKQDCEHPEHEAASASHVDSELLPPYRVDISPAHKPELPLYQPPAFKPQLPLYQPAAFKPQPPPKLVSYTFQPPAYQPQLPKFQPQLPKFQPQLPKFKPLPTSFVPQFVAPAQPQKPVPVDDNEIFGAQQIQTVVVQQQYPAPAPLQQFLRPYSSAAPAVHENCDKPHAVIPSTTTTTTTTTTTAAPEPVVETRQNEIYLLPAKADDGGHHADCGAHAHTHEPAESRAVPSTDYGVVQPYAGYSYDRPAAPLEYPAASAGYAYPKASPSFEYPGASADPATSLFESDETAGKSSGAADDLVILKF